MACFVPLSQILYVYDDDQKVSAVSLKLRLKGLVSSLTSCSQRCTACFCTCTYREFKVCRMCLETCIRTGKSFPTSSFLCVGHNCSLTYCCFTLRDFMICQKSLGNLSAHQNVCKYNHNRCWCSIFYDRVSKCINISFPALLLHVQMIIKHISLTRTFWKSWFTGFTTFCVLLSSSIQPNFASC